MSPTKAQLQRDLAEAEDRAYEATQRADALASELRTLARYAPGLRRLAAMVEQAVADHDGTPA